MDVLGRARLAGGGHGSDTSVDVAADAATVQHPEVDLVEAGPPEDIHRIELAVRLSVCCFRSEDSDPNLVQRLSGFGPPIKCPYSPGQGDTGSYIASTASATGTTSACARRGRKCSVSRGRPYG